MNFQNLFTESEIMCEYYPPFTPDSNGRAERLNRAMLDKSCSVINPLGFSYTNLWADAVATANYIRDVMYRKGCQRQGVTPIRELMGIKPDMSNLRIFGCASLVTIPNQPRVRKFANQAHKGMMAAYWEERTAFPSRKQVELISKDVSTTEEPIKEMVENTMPELEKTEEVRRIMNIAVNTPMEPTGATRAPAPADTLDMITHYPNLRRSDRATHEPNCYRGSS